MEGNYKNQIVDLDGARVVLQARVIKALIILLALRPDVATAECTSLIKGPVVVDVQSCAPVNPATFDTSRDRFKIIRDLDPEGRTALINQYKGLAVKGTIVRSQAIRDGLNTQKGVLQGQNTTFFVPPPIQATCKDLISKRVVGKINEQCCDGRPEAPCLLGTGIRLEQVQLAGDVQTSPDGSTVSGAKSSVAKNQLYIEAENLYLQKKYKQAAATYRKAEANGALDVKGLFRWGNALREIEDCEAALVPLKKVYNLVQQEKVWKEDELNSRRSVFLLARCHAKLGQPSEAVFYLNGFLLDQKKYRSELQQSLKHKDFGWIHTSKEYRQYKAEAEKKLSGT